MQTVTKKIIDSNPGAKYRGSAINERCKPKTPGTI
jgi:hypothetical protein